MITAIVVYLFHLTDEKINHLSFGIFVIAVIEDISLIHKLWS